MALHLRRGWVGTGREVRHSDMGYWCPKCRGDLSHQEANDHDRLNGLQHILTPHSL